MLRSDYIGQECSVARALEAVGERWTLLIVRELLLRPRRFVELEQRLGVSKNLLTARLEKLVALRIVEKAPYPKRPTWSVYQLTSKGTDLFPIIHALMAWGDAHEAPKGPPIVFEHHCGNPVGYRLVCASCGGPVDRDTIHPKPGRVFAGPSRT